MLDAAERNTTQRVQVDEISGSVVRMLEGVRGEIQPQLSGNRRRQLETGVCHDHGMESDIVTGGILMGAALLSWAVSGRAQTKGAPSGEISGTVTANRDYALSEASGNHIPSLYAVRVRARDAERHITYTVFTQKGHYQIYNLPPGNLSDVGAAGWLRFQRPDFELKAGETKTADVALVVRPDKLRAELVDFDTLFPPGPTRDYLMNNCMGCHGYEHIPWQRMGGRNDEVWGNAVSRMFDMDGTSPVNHTGVPQVNPAAIPQEKRDEIVAYFAKIFPKAESRAT